MSARVTLTFLTVAFIAAWLLVACSKQDYLFFDIPEGNASETLGDFASQSSNEIIFNVEEMKQVRTNRVYGKYTRDEALGRMLSGTTLVYASDEKSGAIAVSNSETKNQNIFSP